MPAASVWLESVIHIGDMRNVANDDAVMTLCRDVNVVIDLSTITYGKEVVMSASRHCQKMRTCRCSDILR